MTVSLNVALSGLQARQTQFDNTARNVANVSTRDYRRVETSLQETGQGGVVARSSRSDVPGPVVPAAAGEVGDEVRLSNVELTREIPAMIEASRGFEANLKTIQTQDEMLGELLDILG